jgi:hypothetical protein
LHSDAVWGSNAEVRIGNGIIQSVIKPEYPSSPPGKDVDGKMPAGVAA